MTIETWDPTQPAKTNGAYVIDDVFLQRIVDFMTTLKNNDVSSFLTSEDQKHHQPIILLSKEEWFAKKSLLSADDIIALIRFFTLAEMQFDDWRAEERSPVIWLTKILRQNGIKIDKELLLWIKTESDNKFLPNGAL